MVLVPGCDAKGFPRRSSACRAVPGGAMPQAGSSGISGDQSLPPQRSCAQRAPGHAGPCGSRSCLLHGWAMLLLALRRANAPGCLRVPDGGSAALAKPSPGFTQRPPRPDQTLCFSLAGGTSPVRLSCRCRHCPSLQRACSAPCCELAPTWGSSRNPLPSPLRAGLPPASQSQLVN